MDIEKLSNDLRELKIPTLICDFGGNDISVATKKAQVPSGTKIIAFLDKDDVFSGKSGIFVTDKGVYWYLEGALSGNFAKTSAYMPYEMLAQYDVSVEEKFTGYGVCFSKRILSDNKDLSITFSISSSNDLDEGASKTLLSKIQNFFTIITSLVEVPVHGTDMLRTDFIQAYISGEDENPDQEVLNFYKKAFLKYNVNGVDAFAVHWSWAGFLFSFVHLIHRKAYIESLISVIIGTVITTLSSGLLVFVYWIASGLVNPFLVYKRYSRIIKELKNTQLSNQEKIEVLQKKGSVNKFTSFIGGIIALITIIVFVIVLVRTCFYKGSL